MKREIKFKFVVKSQEGTTVISRAFSLDEILKNAITEEEIIESLIPNECQSSTCNTESQNFCDCAGDEWETAKIIGKLPFSGLNDIYSGDINSEGYVCTWDESLCAFVWYMDEGFQALTEETVSTQIVGNIHDNTNTLNV